MASDPWAGAPDDETLSYSFLLGQDRVLEMLAQGAPAAEVIAELCTVAEGRYAGIQAAVLLAEAGTGKLAVAAAPSLPPALLDALDRLEPAAAEAMLPPLASGEPWFVEALAAEPRLGPLAAAATQAGLGACWSAPIRYPARATAKAPAGGPPPRPPARPAVGLVLFLLPPHRRPSLKGKRVLERVAALVGIALERERLEDRARRERSFDHLTRLPNRAFFERMLADLIDLSDPQKTRFALLLVDLDGFKRVNRSYGYRVGDLVLGGFARRLERSLRRGDLAARVEGDTFALVVRLAETATEPASVGARLLRDIRQGFVFEGQSVELRASLGAAIYPLDAIEPNLLLANAELALVAAQRAGGDRFELYSAVLLEETVVAPPPAAPPGEAVRPEAVELAWETRHLLPTLDPAGVTVRFAWRQPGGALLDAAELWRAAAADQVLGGLTGLMVAEALRGYKSLRAAAGRALRLALPLAAGHLAEGRFEGQLLAALEASGVGASEVDLELPLAAAADAAGDLPARLAPLLGRGVRLALSGYGADPLPLEALRRLPVGLLRLDPALTAAAPRDPRLGAVVSGLIAFARQIGAEVEVDGVERSADLSWFGVQRCTLAAGSALKRPVPHRQLERLAAELRPLKPVS